jgi:hypothetical protein
MLVLVKTVHTLVWVFFVACILGIFAAAHTGRLVWAAALIAMVMVEVAVLAANRMRCPLTDVAGRYTSERADNFDIYLPLWVAWHNKALFGGLYVLGILYTIGRWLY